jgi:anion-transporting  ArsA/GET3 family ATPase
LSREPSARHRNHPGASSAGGSLDKLLAAKEIVVSCGSGGVGKTTVAAAVATMAAVEHGGKILVLTIDPARRLANAMGLEGIGNEERKVSLDAFDQAGVTPRGELWAAMLDTKKSWDDLVRRHAPDSATAERILANAIYQSFSGRFIQSHDYIAMERLFELHAEGGYDLIVVDTPPTRHAIDFLEAPERMANFFSSRLLRWLIIPYRSRLVNLASRPFYQVADRILGSQFLEDIAEFFMLFQAMYDGFVERARAVSALLKDRRTTFMVVSTLEEAPVREAEYFISALQKRGFHLGAVVLNKVLPDYLRDREAARVARTMVEEPGRVAAEVAMAIGDDPLLERVVAEVGESFLNFSLVARRESEQQAELSVAPEVLSTVPFFESDIYDVTGLVELGRHLWS